LNYQLIFPISLIKLGEKLTTEGPHKVEGTPRRLRGLLDGKFIFDTTEGKYVWEHPYCEFSFSFREAHRMIGTDPYFYVPISAFVEGVLEKVDPTTREGYWLAKITAGGKSTDRVLGFDAPGALQNLVRIEVPSLDAWFLEDEKLLGTHPKDPYKRVECLNSSREIRVEVEGVVLAKSTQNVFLFETMLRPRFYLSATSINWEVLTESETTSYCPYKGMAK
jgi:hypothetical protein